MGNYKHILMEERLLVELEEKIMKKIMKVVWGFIVFILMAGLSGCSSSNEEKIETRTDYYISLAEDVETSEELYDIISAYSADEEKQESFKAQLALLGNDTVQLSLLASEDLSPELMVSIFQNHKWANINHAGIRAFLIGKISCMNELTPIQEMEIAEIGEETYQAGLLAKPDVSCYTLCYLLSKDTTKLNLEYYVYREWIYLQVFERCWTCEEKIELLNTGNRTVREVLKEAE